MPTLRCVAASLSAAATTVVASDGTGTGVGEPVLDVVVDVDTHATAMAMVDATTMALNKAATCTPLLVQPRKMSMQGMSATAHRDLELSCTCCGERFLFTAGEQELNAVRGVTHEPHECPACRRRLGRSLLG